VKAKGAVWLITYVDGRRIVLNLNQLSYHGPLLCARFHINSLTSINCIEWTCMHRKVTTATTLESTLEFKLPPRMLHFTVLKSGSFRLIFFVLLTYGMQLRLWYSSLVYQEAQWRTTNTVTYDDADEVSIITRQRTVVNRRRKIWIQLPSKSNRLTVIVSCTKAYPYEKFHEN